METLSALHAIFEGYHNRVAGDLRRHEAYVTSSARVTINSGER